MVVAESPKISAWRPTGAEEACTMDSDPWLHKWPCYTLQVSVSRVVIFCVRFCNLKSDVRLSFLWNLYRWHTLTFAEGILEKHFDKLVNSSGALFAKNQQPFPMESHPFFTEDQINESLNNQQDLINKQYSSTATCEGMIQTRQPAPVLMVPPIRQIPPEVPSQSFPPSIGSSSLQQSFTIPGKVFVLNV